MLPDKEGLKNETEWQALTSKRLARWGLTLEQWEARAARLEENLTLDNALAFARRHGIAVMPDDRTPYSYRVKLAVLTMILAIRAKDEKEFRKMIIEEVAKSAETLGIEA